MAFYRTTSKRAGVTLVELLVVVVILVILVGVILPLVQPSLEGRDLREAARQANAFLMNAQAQAMGSGRDVGVMFVRDMTNANRCFQLKLMRQPLPYMGDHTNARVSIVVLPSGVGRAYVVDVVALEDALIDPSAHQLHQLAASSLQYIMKPGAAIKFHLRGELFSVTGWQLITNSSATQHGPPQWAFDFVVPPQSTLPPGNVEFQVFRAPEVTLSPPLELPGNTCIDLSLSGVASDGTFPIATDAVIVTFSPDGSIGPLYTSWDTNLDGIGDTFVRSHQGKPFGTPYGNALYFMIGRPNQVVTTADALADTDNDLTADFIDEGHAKYLQENNLQDPNGFWVVVDTRTGSTSTANNNAFTVPQPLPSGSDLRLPFATALSRQYALTRLTVGGR